MVRLLKVKELDERKRLILAKSEMYRQTLKLEVANLKFSGTLLKRRMRSPKLIASVLGLAALPAAGFIYGRKLHKPKPKVHAELKAEAGLLPALLAGFQIFRRFAPLVQKLRAGRTQSRARRQNLTHHP